MHRTRISMGGLAVLCGFGVMGLGAASAEAQCYGGSGWQPYRAPTPVHVERPVYVDRTVYVEQPRYYRSSRSIQVGYSRGGHYGGHHASRGHSYRPVVRYSSRGHHGSYVRSYGGHSRAYRSHGRYISRGSHRSSSHHSRRSHRGGHGGGGFRIRFGH